MILRSKTETLRLCFLVILVGACSFFLCFSCKSPEPQPIHRDGFNLTIQPRPLKAGTAAPGNEYTIIAAVATNRPDWPACTNEPVIPRRVHLEFSADGGSTYGKKIAYGVPVTTGIVEYTWSLPWWDDSILTEQGKIRVTNLEGEVMGASWGTFTIAGIIWKEPVAGTILTHGENVDLQWVQAGAGASSQFGYITPTVPFTVVTTFSNCVVGTNNVNWRVTGLPYPSAQLKLVLRSVADPLVYGQTGIVATE